MPLRSDIYKQPGPFACSSDEEDDEDEEEEEELLILVVLLLLTLVAVSRCRRWSVQMERLICSFWKLLVAAATRRLVSCLSSFQQEVDACVSLSPSAVFPGPAAI